MAAIAPPPISRFAPIRTFEHTPPPAGHTQTSGHMYHSHQYQHPQQQQQQQPYQNQSFQYPPTAHTHAHPLAPPPLPIGSSLLPNPPNTPHGKQELEHEKKGTMSRFKRSLQLRTRQPLSRTWEKASFAEECQGAPGSMVDVNTAGVPTGYGGGAGRGGDGAGSLYLPGHEQTEEGVRRRSDEGRNMHAGLFSPTGRPTSLYASPAAIRAFKPLPPVASPTDGSAAPRLAPTPLRA